MPIIIHWLTIFLLIRNYVFAYQDEIFFKEVNYTRREGYSKVKASPCFLKNWFERKLEWKGSYSFDQNVIPLENDLYLGTINFECQYKSQFRETNEILLMTYNQTTVYKAKDIPNKPSRNLCSWKSQFFFEAQESTDAPNTLCMVDNYHIRYKTSKGAFKPKFGCGNIFEGNIRIPKLCFQRPKKITPTKPAISSISSTETDLYSPDISTLSQTGIATIFSKPSQTVPPISSALQEPPNPLNSLSSLQPWISSNPLKTISPTFSTNKSVIPSIPFNSKETSNAFISTKTFSVATSTSSSAFIVSSTRPIIPTTSFNLSESLVSSNFFNSSQHLITTFESTLSQPVSLTSVPITSSILQSMVSPEFSNSSQHLYPTFNPSLHESTSSSISLTISSFLHETVLSNSSFLQSMSPSLSSTLQSLHPSISTISQPVVPPLFSNSSQSISSSLLITLNSTLSSDVISSTNYTKSEFSLPQTFTSQTPVLSISTLSQPVQPNDSFTSSKPTLADSSKLSTPVLPTSLMQPETPTTSFNPPLLDSSISTLSQPVVLPLYSNSSQPVLISSSSTLHISVPSTSASLQPLIPSASSAQPELILSTSTSSQLVISTTFLISSLVNPSVSSVPPKHTLPVSSSSREPDKTILTLTHPVISSFKSYLTTTIHFTGFSSQLVNPPVDSRSYKPIPSISSSLHLPNPFTSTPSKQVIPSRSSLQLILDLSSILSQTKTSPSSSIEPEPILSISSSVPIPASLTSTLSHSVSLKTVTSKSSNLVESISLTSSILPNTVLTITSTFLEPGFSTVFSSSLELDPNFLSSNTIPFSTTLKTRLITTTLSQQTSLPTLSNSYQTSSLFNSSETILTSTFNFSITIISSSSNLLTSNNLDSEGTSLLYPSTKTSFSNFDKLSASIDALSSIYPSFPNSSSNNFDTFKTYDHLTPYITSSTNHPLIFSSTYYTTERLEKTTFDLDPITLSTIIATTVKDNEFESTNLIGTTTLDVTHTFTSISSYAINNLVLPSHSSAVPGLLSFSSVTVYSTPTTTSSIPLVDIVVSSNLISVTLSLNDISVHLAGTKKNYPSGRLLLLLTILFF